MSQDGKKKSNKPIRITRRKHRLRGWIDGTAFTIHVRTYRDKHGKRRTVVAGPGLKDA
jgi:hypothetical protein